MGRAPCCDKTKVKRGPWSPEEDNILKTYINQHGTGGNWILFPQKAGLKRCGKSCRLRWLNYLRPNIKHGGFTEEEDNIIFTLYNSIGSRWSIIASHLPERTDNDVKNHWNTKLKKKLFSAPTNITSSVSLHNNHNMLPYFPTAQIQLPELIEIPENKENIVFKTEPSFSRDDNASASTSAASWSYDVLNAFEMNDSDFDYSVLSSLLGNDFNTEQSFPQSLTY